MSPVSPEKPHSPFIPSPDQQKRFNISNYFDGEQEKMGKPGVCADQVLLKFPQPLDDPHQPEQESEYSNDTTAMATFIEGPATTTENIFLPETQFSSEFPQETYNNKQTISSIHPTSTCLVDDNDYFTCKNTPAVSSYNHLTQQQECATTLNLNQSLVVEGEIVTPELGAESFVCKMGESIEIEQEIMHEDRSDITEFVQQSMGSSGLHPRVDYSRRISYEEMVHQDGMETNVDCSSSCLSDVSGAPPSMEKCLITLTQWALTLQDVYEDRQSGPINPSSVSKCQCSKADSLMRELKIVETDYYDVIGMCDKAAINPNLSDFQLRSVQNLSERILDVQNVLRTCVSIRISNPSEDVKSKAAFLVGEVCDVRQYVRDAVDSLVQLVYDLMHVTECKSHSKQKTNSSAEHIDQSHVTSEIENNDVSLEVESDMCLGVASLGTSDDQSLDTVDEETETEDEETQNGDKENNAKRKRKQTLKPSSTSKLPSTSPTSSPSKRPRRSRTCSAPCSLDSKVLDLLESKRKGMRNNGLYQFVLWRQALKAEKDRVTTTFSGFDSPVKTAMNRRRLSFN